MTRNAPLIKSSRDARSIAKQTLVQRAEKLFEAEDVDGSLAILSDAEAIYPDEPRIPFLIGKYTAKKRSTPEGIHKLEATLTRFPKHLPTLLELGDIHLRPGHMTLANPFFQRALELAPRLPEVHGALGALQQRLGNLPGAVEHYRSALKLQLKTPPPKSEPPRKASFRIRDAETLLWSTLTLMARNGVHMFPAFGTLLGLVRNGSLLAHDKDVDTGLPFSEMGRAISILTRNGWHETNHSFGLMNPRALHHKQADISMDIAGFVVENQSGNSLTSGAWMKGLPKDWNMIFEFPPIRLEKRPVCDGGGPVWMLKEPERWLETLYGNWQEPDKNFDTMVAAKNLRGFSMLSRCYAYSRILYNWNTGRRNRALVLARHVLAREPADPLMQKVVSRLNH